MASKFSEDCKYFAFISNDGKLKIWDTVTNTLEQEFTPEYHLTSPCKCLHFINSTLRKEGSPRKKKKRESNEISSRIALGTSSGKFLLYSIGKATLESSIEGNNRSINCLSWTDSEIVYSGVENYIIAWDINKKYIQNKWKAGKETITCILKVPNSNRLLTASRSIKLWDSSSKTLLHTYSGHSHDTIILQYVKPRNSTEAYFISGSKGDRLLNCWSLNENRTDESSLVSFLLDDVPLDVSVAFSTDGASYMSATTSSGVAHIFRHTLNGRTNKPLKPKQTIQVVAGANKSDITPIPILCSKLNVNISLLIGHGNCLTITFENVLLTDHEKVQCLIRKDPRLVQLKKSRNRNNSKINTPVTSEVHYSTPFSSTSTSSTKRRNDGSQEIPMEKRLENLTINKRDGKPQMENLAHLLVQGLHSKDKFLLSTVFQGKEEEIIKNTVKRLPLSVIVLLVETLSQMMQGKTISSQIGALWLHHVVQNHASLLISNSSIMTTLGPIMTNIESRLSLQAPLSKLKGRLNLLLSQITSSESGENNLNEEPLLFYNDKDSSDLDIDTIDLETHAENDNEWNEEDSDKESSDQESEEAEMIDDSDSEISA